MLDQEFPSQLCTIVQILCCLLESPLLTIAAWVINSRKSSAFSAVIPKAEANTLALCLPEE